MDDLMTADERELVHDLGRCWKRFEVIVGDHPLTGPADRAEALGHVHALQHAIMAQAAGRAYPREFRALGEVIAKDAG